MDRTVAATDSALKSKGWTKVATVDKASAVVLINGAAQQQETSTTMYSGGGYGGWGWRGGGMGMATTSTSTYAVGTLVVDIFDAATKQLLFRGQAQETVNKNPQKNTEDIYKSMAKMFKTSRRRRQVVPDERRNGAPRHGLTAAPFRFLRVDTPYRGV
jgi:hypothetical protein